MQLVVVVDIAGIAGARRQEVEMMSVVNSATVAGFDSLMVPVIDFEVDRLEEFELGQMPAVETE